MPPIIRVLRPGDTSKPNPFTIAIVANPALEVTCGTQNFEIDPVASNQAAFDRTATYIVDCLFGRLTGQAEQFVADAAVGPKIRVISWFMTGLPADSDNALVCEERDLIEPRLDGLAAFLPNHGIRADIVYAVSASPRRSRASAFGTDDDNSGGGVAFTLDGVTLHHRWNARFPGTVAIHTSSDSLTALHEFGHALSSYTNGFVTDLYVGDIDAPGIIDVNKKLGRPIPQTFGEYNGAIYRSDRLRDGLGYDPTWTSYHCELTDPALPAVMDAYNWIATPESCRHDKITRRFLLDRLIAKVSRP